MIWGTDEVTEILRMFEVEHLDIRTTTLGVNLLGCATGDYDTTCARIRERMLTAGDRLVATADAIQADLGVPIINRRISVTPMSLVLAGTGADNYVKAAVALDEAGGDLGVDYVAGFSALVAKGYTPSDRVLIESVPEALSTTARVCSSIEVANSRSGIHMDAVRHMGHVIKETAERTASDGAIGCCKFVVFANAVEDNPFVAGAMHGVGEHDVVVNVGVSGPGVVAAALKRLHDRPGHAKPTFGEIVQTIKRMAYKVTRAGELIGREMADRLGPDVGFGIVDLSLAPTPAIGDSVADILEAMGLERTGTHGTTAALALLTDAVKKGGIMASAYVGGLSGAFIPVSEDAGMIRAVQDGALSLDKLEAMTSVCSVGLDMVAVPGDTPAETLSGIIADEMAIGVCNHKTTAVRIIPVPGMAVGDLVEWGGLLGAAPIMAVHKWSSAGFVRTHGRIPAPLTSVRN